MFRVPATSAPVMKVFVPLIKPVPIGLSKRCYHSGIRAGVRFGKGVGKQVATINDLR
jgi:hypothetical protein